MGIKGLNKLISQYAASAITQKHISEFSGSKVAIDSEILIHKYRTVDSKNSHIFGFINNVFWNLENGIVPIYVFDGCPNIVKQTNVLTKRFNYKEQITCKIEELENKFVEQLDQLDLIDKKDSPESNVLGPEINDTLDQLFKIQRKLSFMTVSKNHRNECKYLLKLMGIPFIVANEDAEAFCVVLQRRGIANYVYTEDTDIIPYYIASFEHNFFSKPIKVLRKGYLSSMVTVIDVSEIIKQMELSPRSFIDMCILSGCDFCTTIPKIGPIKAYNYMQKYQTIENLKNAGICIPDDFKYQDARDIFFKSHDQNIEKSLELGMINEQDLKIYLQNERNLNPYPIIDKYHKIYTEFQSSNKQTWFSNGDLDLSSELSSINKNLGVVRIDPKIGPI
jgi:flap endonuclease-1